jgi:hypothetical protein
VKLRLAIGRLLFEFKTGETCPAFGIRLSQIIHHERAVILRSFSR